MCVITAALLGLFALLCLVFANAPRQLTNISSLEQSFENRLKVVTTVSP